MKRFLSVILAAVLVTAVGGSVVRGTLAGFSDSEVSTENWLCAGSRILELSGGPLVVHNAWPCKWYSQEYTLINAGTLDGTAYVHIPNTDDPCGKWQGLKCVEDAPGAGVATSEPELVAEEGGKVDSVQVTGLGVDKCNICDYIDIKIYFEDQLKVSGKLSEIACKDWLLGVIPASPSYTYGKGGGWGSYFTYHIGTETQVLPLIAGKTITTGTVTVWNDSVNLYVRYNITAAGYTFKETHVYVGKTPPPKLAPGSFPWKHEKLGAATYDLYTIPLSSINGGVVPCNTIYIAAHASNCETYWAQGEARKVRVELHFPDIDEEDLGLNYFNDSIPAEVKWDHWPTNAYQGDGCTFDMVFKFQQTCGTTWWYDGKKWWRR